MILLAPNISVLYKKIEQNLLVPVHWKKIQYNSSSKKGLLQVSTLKTDKHRN